MVQMLKMWVMPHASTKALNIHKTQRWPVPRRWMANTAMAAGIDR